MIATAIAADAVPRDVGRFKALDAFAQALATVQTSYVDPVDEKQLLYDAARGMLHNLDPHSTFLPPKRYQHLRQDTEGEFGGVGAHAVARASSTRRARACRRIRRSTRSCAGSPAEVAGLQVDDASSRSTARRPPRSARSSRTRARGRPSCAARRARASPSASCAPAGRSRGAFTLVRAQVKQPTVRHRVLEQRHRLPRDLAVRRGDLGRRRRRARAAPRSRARSRRSSSISATIRAASSIRRSSSPTSSSTAARSSRSAAARARRDTRTRTRVASRPACR